MSEIKKKKHYYNNFILLIFCCVANFNSNAWFGWGFVNSALKEHSEAYAKFVPEKSATEIKIDVAFNRPGFLRYTPETPNLLGYLESFKKLENKVMVRSMTKSFLFSLLVGLYNGYNLSKPKSNGSVFKPVLAGLLGGLAYSILSVMDENRSTGKHPYFDEFLRKHDNYFSNLSFPTAVRIAMAYSSFVTGWVLSASSYIAIKEKIKKK